MKSVVLTGLRNKIFSCGGLAALSATLVLSSTAFGDTVIAKETVKKTQVCIPGSGCNISDRNTKLYLSIGIDVSGIPNFSEKMTSQTSFVARFGPSSDSVSGFGRQLLDDPNYQEGDTSVVFKSEGKPKVTNLLTWDDATVTYTLIAKGGFAPLTSSKFDLADGVNNESIFVSLTLEDTDLDELVEKTVPVTIGVKSKTKTKSDGTETTRKNLSLLAEFAD